MKNLSVDLRQTTDTTNPAAGYNRIKSNAAGELLIRTPAGVETVLGEQGDKGDQGDRGPVGGWTLEHQFSTAVLGAPAVGHLELDNASPSLVTKIYVSDTDRHAGDIDLTLDEIAPGDYVRVFRADGTNASATYEVTVAVDSGGFHTYDVTYLSHSGTFVNDGNVGYSFAPQGTKGDTGEKGDTGDTGAAGADGTNGIDGTNGTDGIDGVDGDDGADGADGDSGINGYATTFVDADLATGILTITHNMNQLVVPVVISNDSNNQIIPDNVVYTSVNVCTVSLVSQGTITGTWNAMVQAGDGTVSAPAEIGFAASDETTDLTTGVAKTTFRAPYAVTLNDVRINVNAAPTGSSLIVDVKKNGTTIFSTLVSIDAGEKTSVTAATPAVISVTDIADDDEITVDITQIGSTFAGSGLKVWLLGVRA